MGYIYIELLLILEYLFDGLWGYQLVGLFVLISCFGLLDEFKYFVDICYQVGIGVIIDWVLVYFLEDGYGLVCFDGIYVYEYEDLCKGWYLDWNLCIYDFGK